MRNKPIKCIIHGDNCPGDDGGFLIDGNHPDDMFGLGDTAMNGSIVRLMGEKGFGFVRGDDQKDYFFHRSDFHGFFDDLIDDVRGNRTVRVTFDVVSSQKGPRAANVMRVDMGV